MEPLDEWEENVWDRTWEEVEEEWDQEWEKGNLAWHEDLIVTPAIADLTEFDTVLSCLE